MRAAADAGHPDAIPDPPQEGWAPDLLAGVSIALCTGQDRGNARHAMADELRAVGAEVKVYELNSGRTPDRFAPGTLVVIDIRFAGHAESERARLAAERADCRWLEVNAGQGGLVRAVVKGLGL
jgi:hypothetical protein